MMRNCKSKCDGTQWKSSARAILIALAAFVAVSALTLSIAPAVLATDDSNPSAVTQIESTDSNDSNQKPIEAPLSGRPRFGKFIERFNIAAEPSEEELHAHPALYFRVWANKPLPPVRTFFFLVFVSLVVAELLPLRMEKARAACSRNFWKCFWGGILGTFILCTLARGAYLSHIGMPLALLSLGLLQFLLLMGFSVSATLLGQTILTICGVKRSVGLDRPWIRRLGEPILGCFLLSLLLIIPPFGPLPRIGVRLILLLCFLGLGAWFRTGLGTKEIGGASEI
ncbi:MAG TPA: hypothetical protein V6C76_04270 [Drouetiella sp.]